MRQTTSNKARWQSLTWLSLLIAASAALTTWFACITPFVAFGVMAATTLSRRNALGLTVAVWLANQAVGFGLLHYPSTGTSVAWGVAIGGAAVIGTLTAQWAIGRLGSSRSAVQAIAAFVSAFALYELALYVVALSILGGTRAFAAPIVGQVLVVNTAAFIGLYGLNQAVTVGIAYLGRRPSAHVSPARFA
jgi:hypothetical protein